MCETCGCALPAHEPKHTHTNHTKVTVLQDLLAENDHQAAHNRAHFSQHVVFVINLMSSPGAGKTSLIEATIDALREEYRIAVIVGDLETENDAQRVRAKGIPAVQITTSTACHLDARLIHDVLHELPLQGIDLLFIENVGNLVCPANFDLGQHRNVTLLSVPEGDDKPAKYPIIFRAADLILCTKLDLLTFLPEFKIERAEAALRALASSVPFLPISSRDARQIEPWLTWLRAELTKFRTQGAST